MLRFIALQWVQAPKNGKFAMHVKRYFGIEGDVFITFEKQMTNAI